MLIKESELCRDYKIIFVRLSQYNIKDFFPRDNLPPFALMQTQEILKNKHRISSLIIDGQLKPCAVSELVNKCISLKPRIVVLSCFSVKIYDCKIFFKAIKMQDPEIICVAVGHLATYCTRRICHPDSNVDFVIRGEFQIILPDFLRQLLSPMPNISTDGLIFTKESKNLSMLNIIHNVDILPAIPYTEKILNIYTNVIPVPVFKRVIWGRLFSSYGCPNSCIFCTQTIRETYGKKYRKRSIQSIMEELKYLKSVGANIIEFSDDNFTCSKEHYLSLCQSIINNKLNIQWGGHVRVDDLTYKSLCLMKKAGCIFIKAGIESGSERVLSCIKKTTFPETWRSQTKAVFGWAKSLNIMTIANFILGNPDETEDDIKKTEDLIFEIEPDILQLHSFCAYPGSEAYINLHNEPSDQVIAEMHHYNQFKLCDRHDFLAIKQKNIMLKFYFRPRYIIKHIIKFLPYYILNIKKFYLTIRSAVRIPMRFNKKHE